MSKYGGIWLPVISSPFCKIQKGFELIYNIKKRKVKIQGDRVKSFKMLQRSV